MTMAGTVLRRIPVVAGLAYVERNRLLPSGFTVALAAEPDNRYFPHAIAVTASGQKVGYVAPEVARRYFDVVASAGSPIECPARRAGPADHETSGVELLLDFSNLSISPGE